MDPEAPTAAASSQGAGLPGGTGAASAAFVSANRPPLDADECAAAAAYVDRRMPAVLGADKAALLRMCREAGLPGNKNDGKAKLVARIRGDLRGRAEDAVRAESATRRGRLGRVTAPSTSGGQALVPAPPAAAPSGDPSGSPDPGCLRHEAGAASASPSRDSSPVLPAGKRPRAAAPPFLPTPTPSHANPAAVAPPSGPIGAGRRRPAPPPAPMTDPVDARRRSHAAASARPARIDEILELHGELRRWQCCLRGLMDVHDETPEELFARVEVVVQELVGQDEGPVVLSDCWRVGRYAPERPRPVIIRFARLQDKVAALRGKGVLYGEGMSDILKEWVEETGGVPLRLYHDLSAGQLDWKRRLRGAFDAFLKANTRVVWRRGYRLFALLEGTWVEFYPQSALVP